MDKSASKPDDIARVLRVFIEEDEGTSRSLWQKILDVSNPALTQWLSGNNLPRSETFVKILVKNSSSQSGRKVRDGRQELDSLALRAAEPASLLGKQGYESLAEYLANGVISRVSNRLEQVLPNLTPSQQIALMVRVEESIALDQEPMRPPDSTAWLHSQFRVAEREIRSVTDSICDSVLGTVRHSQLLLTLHKRHPGHDDPFLESAMFLTAWESDEIGVLHGTNRLDMKDSTPLQPAEVIGRIKPKRASVQYRRLATPFPIRRGA